MWWFFGSRKKEIERVRVLEQKIYELEKTLVLVKMTLQNLQSALLAMSRTQDSIGRDISSIGEVVENIVGVFEVEAATPFPLQPASNDDDLPN
tara:strand:+ start:633 stop:911 length:279 start_codon:yes stop_codon:yes gene_type:complete